MAPASPFISNKFCYFGKFNAENVSQVPGLIYRKRQMTTKDWDELLEEANPEMAVKYELMRA